MPHADPDAAARKIIELANAVEIVQDGRIHIEKFNGPMLFELKATPAEYKAEDLFRFASIRAARSVTRIT
jgi:hypothetical protein